MTDEIPIGSEPVALLDKTLTLTVDLDLSVRVRIRGSSGELLADIATTPRRAIAIAGLFCHAAKHADPSLRLVVRQIEVGS